jgi:hypothetical protein
MMQKYRSGDFVIRHFGLTKNIVQRFSVGINISDRQNVDETAEIRDKHSPNRRGKVVPLADKVAISRN